LNLSASTYYGQQSNLIIPSEFFDGTTTVFEQQLNRDGTFTPLGPRRLITAANGGTSHNAGVDLFGRATFGHFSPWASYSYVDSEINLPGLGTEATPGVSRHSGRLGVTWAAAPKLFITPSLVIRSRPQNVLASNGETLNIPSLARQLDVPYQVDLAVVYRVSEHVEFFVTLRNLTNHKYALGGFNGNGHGKLFALPGETINGVAGLKMSF
jgi:outer membrane receptor protein involved in Fe transport